MGSFSAFNIAVIAVISAHNMIFPVNGQCTVEGCETGDTSISIATEIRQMLAEFHDRLQAIDRRSQEQEVCIKQVLSAHELLNASHQESETQHETFLNRLEAIDRRLSELGITIKNETQNSWKPAIAVGIDLEGGPVPPIINNWTVLMHRFDGSLNFNRSWIEYKNGFGDSERGEFWLGNEKIYRLTNRRGVVYTLRIEVQLRKNGAWYHADYSTFSLDSENNKYALRLSGYSGGNAGDSITNTSFSSDVFLDGMSFSTWDADNDRSGGKCASDWGGGWWYNSCHLACLTCSYNSFPLSTFQWRSLNHVSSDFGLLRAARMMIRSR